MLLTDSVFVGLERFLEETAIIFVNNLNQLIFVMETRFL
jgi:hypothetical protein